MHAVEFRTRVNTDRTLTVPPAVAAALPPGRPVRVLLLIGEEGEREDAAWEAAAAAEFAAGYADGDAIYDQFSPR